MIRSHSYLLVIVLSLQLIACEKEPDRMDNYWVDFATVIKTRDQLSFQIDHNPNRVVPDQPIDEVLAAGQRVILNYTPVRDDIIHVNDLRKVFTGVIILSPSMEIFTDPVKVQSIWVTDDHINMILEIEYHHTPHTFALYRDPTDLTHVNLFLSHSKNDDSPGHAEKVYLSFSLHSLSPTEMDRPFKVNLHTREGIRIFYINHRDSEEKQIP